MQPNENTRTFVTAPASDAHVLLLLRASLYTNGHDLADIGADRTHVYLRTTTPGNIVRANLDSMRRYAVTAPPTFDDGLTITDHTPNSITVKELRCICFREHGVGKLRRDPDCPEHGDRPPR